MPDSIDTLFLKGRLLYEGAPVRVWIEVQDDDLFLHDFVAAGRTRGDGSFELRFSRTAFNQQPWESQAVPHLSLFVWHPAAPDRRPPDHESPSHHLTFSPSVFRDGAADLGTLDLSASPALRGSWTLRQLRTSRRPGPQWTLDQLRTLSDEVAGRVAEVCRVPKVPDVALRIAPLENAAGRYRFAAREIDLDEGTLPFLDQDAVRRLLAHEWAHALCFEDVPPAGSVPLPEQVRAWARDLAPSMETTEAAILDCVTGQAITANWEGFAHYVEEQVAVRWWPLGAGPSWPLIGRVTDAILSSDLSETALREALRQTPPPVDSPDVRYLGLSWYRHEYRDGESRIRFRRSATGELLEACVRLFEHRVRGEGGVPSVPQFEP